MFFVFVLLALVTFAPALPPDLLGFDLPDDLLWSLVALDRLIDLLHLNGIIHDGLLGRLLLLHDHEHRIFMSQHKVLAPCIGDLLLEDLLDLTLLARRLRWFACEILLCVLIVLDSVAPIVHPVHSVEM